MNSHDEHLRAALRTVASASRQDASPEVYATLVEAFRRHHRRRLWAMSARITALAACLLLMAALAWRRWVNLPQPPEVVQWQTRPPEHAPPLLERPAAATVAKVRPKHQSARLVVPSSRVRTAENFLVLPAFDPVMAADDMHIVRLQMPGADLRRAGVPVDEEALGALYLTDFVVGRDGTPYGARIVQAKFVK